MGGVSDQHRFEVHLLLKHWAFWKQTCFVGLSFPSRTLEHRLASGEILGSGHNGGPDPFKSGPHFRDDAVAQVVEAILKKMDSEYRRGTIVLKMVYLMDHSIRRVSSELRVSRREAATILNNAERMFGIYYQLHLDGSLPIRQN